MIRKLVIVLALVGSIAACGKNKAVKAAEDMADAVCACNDASCALDAATKAQKRLLELADETGTESDAQAILDAGKRAADCLKKLSK